MAKSLSELKAKLSSGVVAAADLKARRMLEAMDLAEIRKDRQVTQNKERIGHQIRNKK